MRIGIDGNEANVENRVGVNQYAYELLWNFKKLQDAGKTSHSFVIFLKDPPRNLPSEGKKWKYVVIPGGSMWIVRKLLPRLFFGRDNLSLFFSPSHYLPPISRVKQICSIMDLGYLKFSDQFRTFDFWQLKLWSAWSIFISNIVLTISKATERDVLSNYKFASGKTRVVLLSGDSSVYGANISTKDTRLVKRKYGIDRDFVLYLGTLKPSKNIEGLLNAWKKVKEKGKTKLVIAGKKGWLFEPIFKLSKELSIEESVVFTDFVPEEDKPYLMKGAKVFVLPSFWEGFGIDVLNAFSCGVPAIVSRRGSLPEVAGRVGIYINPEEPREIARAIEEVLKMGKKEYNSLSMNCVKRARQFSWEKTAMKILKVFNNV